MRGDDLGDGAYRVARPEVHHPHAAGAPALTGNGFGVYPDRGPEVRDDHEFVQVWLHHLNTRQASPVAIGLHRDYSLSPTPLNPELREGGALAEALLRDKKE